MKRYLLCLLCVALLLAGTACGAHSHSYVRTIIPPSCKSLGYTVNSCSCGDTYYSDYQAMTPHLFGEWRPGQKPASLTDGGEEYCVCGVCGVLETRDTENRSSLPKFYLQSVLQTEEEQTVSLLYSRGEQLRVQCQSLLSRRDGSGKPSYTLELLSSESRETEYKVDLGWGERSRYRLCALSPDSTWTRALAAETLWLIGREGGRVTVSDAVGKNIVQVYENGNYRGLYALLPEQNAWLETLGGLTDAALLAVDDGESCLFLTRPTYTDDGSEEGFAFLGYTGTDTDWARESFAGFSDFVRRSKDAAFKSQLSQYTDPEELIDYFLYLYLFGLPQGDTRNTVWYTSDGVHWLPTFYDLNCTYGLKPDGSLRDGTFGIPSAGEDGGITYNGENLLWKRLSALYAQEIRERYAFLRAELWDASALAEQFSELCDRIEPELLVAEAELELDSRYSEKSLDKDRIASFLQKRLDRMDAWLYTPMQDF